MIVQCFVIFHVETTPQHDSTDHPPTSGTEMLHIPEENVLVHCMYSDHTVLHYTNNHPLYSVHSRAIHMYIVQQLHRNNHVTCVACNCKDVHVHVHSKYGVGTDFPLVV